MDTQEKSGCATLIALIALGVVLFNSCSSITKPSVSSRNTSTLNISDETSQSIKNLKRELCVHLEQLLEFRYKRDFGVYGFGSGGPYYSWLLDLEALSKAQPYGPYSPIPLALRAAPDELIQVGMDFAHNRIDSNYTKQKVTELKRLIGYDEYKNKHTSQ